MDAQHGKFMLQSRRHRAVQLAHFSSAGLAVLLKVDKYISYFQNGILSSLRSDPLHALCIQRLARTRFKRYTLSGQQGDLNQSILGFTEAIFLQLPWNTRYPDLNIIQIFYFLTLAIFIRVEGSKQPEDIKCCIAHLRYLRGQWHQVHIDGLFPVAETLVRALAVKADLDFGDVDQDIKEMAGLCDELLNSDLSSNALADPIMAFVGVIVAHPHGPFRGKIPSDGVIGCLRKAVIQLPDLHLVSIVLAQSLYNRILMTSSEADFKEGVTILDEVIRFRDTGDRPSQYSEEALDLAARFFIARFNASGKPEHLENAIYRLRTLLDRTSRGNPNRPMVTKFLFFFQGLRFDDSIGGAKALSGTSEFAKCPPFYDLIASLPELDTDTSTMTFTMHFNALQLNTIECLTDIAEIKDGIMYCRQLLASYPRSSLAPLARSALGNLFHCAFKRTKEIKYLNEAISATRDQITAADPSMDHFLSLNTLIAFLLTRLDILHRREDLDELMELFPVVGKHEHAHLSRHSPLSCVWASIARRSGHSSTSAAYELAMSAMQDYLTFSPTLDIQHSQLVAMTTDFKTLPLDYASYQIHTGRLQQAITTLERGRALLWSEMRGLRTSIDQISLADSDLAEKFIAINRELETLTFSPSLIYNVDDGDRDLKGMHPFGHLVSQQQKLLDDHKELISQIQAMSGFDTFLRPPSFDTLCSSAKHGPVIIINHCKWRSDIIVISHGSLPSLITTPDDFYSRAKRLQDQLLEERNKGLESDKYEDSLRSVLKELYDLVGRPVINKLNELNVPEQSRVWWCPTSVFCSLPLHAMGPIPSDTGPLRYFLDLYIPSYTPSLSALIESRKPGSQSNDKPSILLVAQPDEKMPQALKEMKVVQAASTQVTTLFSAKATPTAVVAHLRDHPFAHIVCHGILEPGKPFEASFKLHKGKRLPLLDIVRSQHPNAEFAFLSACHTAELTEASIADEVLHLAAAMQFCGYRSVVGTMWAMADTDGWDLARGFYQSVFSDEMQEARYYERTAAALRDAMVKLRRKRGMSLERWVNYVHYGA